MNNKLIRQTMEKGKLMLLEVIFRKGRLPSTRGASPDVRREGTCTNITLDPLKTQHLSQRNLRLEERRGMRKRLPGNGATATRSHHKLQRYADMENHKGRRRNQRVTAEISKKKVGIKRAPSQFRNISFQEGSKRPCMQHQLTLDYNSDCPWIQIRRATNHMAPCFKLNQSRPQFTCREAGNQERKKWFSLGHSWERINSLPPGEGSFPSHSFQIA